VDLAPIVALSDVPENADAATAENTAASPNEPATTHRVDRDTERVPISRAAARRAGLSGPNTGGSGSVMRGVSGPAV
jgi:hypothetical protein